MKLQVGFIGGICLPCYDLLVQVLPATGPMQQNCKDNLNTWKDKADERRREMAALEAKIAEENSKEKGTYSPVLFKWNLTTITFPSISQDIQKL